MSDPCGEPERPHLHRLRGTTGRGGTEHRPQVNMHLLVGGYLHAVRYKVFTEQNTLSVVGAEIRLSRLPDEVARIRACRTHGVVGESVLRGASWLHRIPQPRCL